MKDEKAAGPDVIQGELLKLLDDENIEKLIKTFATIRN